MKRVGIVLALVLLLSTPVISFAKKNPWDIKLPFKSATIHYTHSGNVKGQETLYIRNYGKETAEYANTTSSMLGGMITEHDETITITTPDWIYTFDLTEQTGQKSGNPTKYMIEEYNKLSRAEKKQVDKNAEELGLAMTTNLGGKVELKAAKILGYTCDRTTIMGTTVHTIHNTPIPLKTEANMGVMAMSIVATEIKEGKVSSKYFDFPQGIEPVYSQEGDNASRAMAKNVISMLKDPDGAQKARQQQPAQQQPQQQSDAEQQAPVSVEEQAMKALQGLFGN